MLDVRRPIADLHNDWEQCQNCELGARRISVGGNFVRGEGKTRGVLFVGEGPGVDEEMCGRPFIGASGKILRSTLDKLGFTDFYITNTVTCRSCTPFTDPQGNPRLRKGLPIYKDERPLPTQIEACRPRLNEEIYLVDPVIIVALGGTAAEALLQRPVTITKERGTTEAIDIPGATHRPVLTEKKGAWVRKVNGAFLLPTEVNPVQYLVMPTLHPAYVARQLADRGPRGAFQLFVGDIRTSIKIYEKFRLEVYGETTTVNDEPIDYSQEDYDV